MLQAHDIEVYLVNATFTKNIRGRKPFAVETYAYQLSDGVDLLEVDGVSFDFILTLLSEVGMDLSAFPTAKHFVFWLSLSPNKKVSGEKVLSSKTAKNKSRLRQAFLQSALGVSRKKNNVLTHFYWRMASTKGKGTAAVATARKLAIIVYNMLQKKEPYTPQQLEHYQQKVRDQKIKQIQKTIQKLQLKESELIFS